MAAPDPHQVEPYAVRLSPILKPKVWGGRRLAEWGRPLPAGEPIGESWEIADLAQTAASGGGGDAARSIIANGPLAGTSLSEALSLWGDAALGSAWLSDDGGFPLLVKLLDAQQELSVQVHPSPAYASADPEAHLKAECWYVLEATPAPDGSPAAIYAGLADGVDADELFARIAADEPGAVPAALRRIEVAPGEMYFLPSGTVHALGAGVLVAEVQTPSDTTFRVYDWAHEHGRVGRELHIEQARACLLEDACAIKTVAGDEPLVASDEFTVELLPAGEPLEPADRVRAVLACARGRTEAWVVPAGIGREPFHVDALVATPMR